MARMRVEAVGAQDLDAGAPSTPARGRPIRSSAPDPRTAPRGRRPARKPLEGGVVSSTSVCIDPLPEPLPISDGRSRRQCAAACNRAASGSVFRQSRMLQSPTTDGWPERSKAPVLKTGRRASVSWVRIPPHPPPPGPRKKRRSLGRASEISSASHGGNTGRHLAGQPDPPVAQGTRGRENRKSREIFHKCSPIVTECDHARHILDPNMRLYISFLKSVDIESFSQQHCGCLSSETNHPVRIRHRLVQILELSQIWRSSGLIRANQ